jgi:hypothetical protein
MSFDEALRRVAQTDPRELHEAKKASPRKPTKRVTRAPKRPSSDSIDSPTKRPPPIS